jgi:hypothetical protein
MKLCQVYFGLFGCWGWEHVGDDGTVDESRGVFESFDECVEDARRNGYTVAPATQTQPADARSVSVTI